MAKNEKAIVQVIAKENDTTAVMKEIHKASDIEENDIKATFRNGTLTIEIPKKDEKKEIEEKKYIQIGD